MFLMGRPPHYKLTLFPASAETTDRTNLESVRELKLVEELAFELAVELYKSSKAITQPILVTGEICM